MKKQIYFITGASGTGKTSLIDALKKKYADKNWEFLHFDSIGVPSVEVMNQRYGSPSAWQEAMTYQWIERLIHDDHECIFFEGQVNLKFIQNGFSKHNFTDYKIILLDCSAEVMTYRLTHHREQAELLTQDMYNWLAFLRNQASELGEIVVDTTGMASEDVLTEFENKVLIS